MDAITSKSRRSVDVARLKPGKLLIGGRWSDPRSGRQIDTINPTTEGVAGSVAEGGEAELDDAVAAARAALDGPWAGFTGLQRTQALMRLADAFERNLEDLAIRQVLEMGKNIRQSRFEIEYLVNLFRYHAGWATKLDGSVKHVPGGFHCYTTHDPVGVVAAITPYNVPLYLMATKLAPALAAGCTFIHKPATATSLSALKFAEVFLEADLPPGLYNLVTGPGGSLGKAIARHRGIDKVAFTGSTEVGVDIVRESAATMKRVTMELGGKSPNIVLADADLDTTATNAVLGNFINSGQICTSGSRLIVERPVYEEVVERVVNLLGTFKIGDPLEEDTFFGPVASKGAQTKIMGYIESGKAEAKLATGGNATTVDGKGYFVQPTVFVDATNDIRIAREEIFGPVLTVIPVKDIDEAIAVGNATDYGLASAVQTRDIKKAFKVARALKAGSVWVNTEYQWNEASPYGGFKMSGHGRENGREAYESYLETKTVWIDAADAPAA